LFNVVLNILGAEGVIGRMRISAGWEDGQQKDLKQSRSFLAYYPVPSKKNRCFITEILKRYFESG
jgi:hypothetical protein